MPGSLPPEAPTQGRASTAGGNIVNTGGGSIASTGVPQGSGPHIPATSSPPTAKSSHPYPYPHPHPYPYPYPHPYPTWTTWKEVSLDAQPKYRNGLFLESYKAPPTHREPRTLHLMFNAIVHLYGVSQVLERSTTCEELCVLCEVHVASVLHVLHVLTMWTSLSSGMGIYGHAGGQVYLLAWACWRDAGQCMVFAGALRRCANGAPRYHHLAGGI